MRPRGKIILGYLFGPKRDVLPTLAEVAMFRPQDALKRLHIGDLGLLNGEWSIVGELSPWDRTEWRTPEFVRRDLLSRRAKRIVYSDDNPNEIEREEPVPYDITGLEDDALCGCGGIEIDPVA
jgi:hypothetical protein